MAEVLVQDSSLQDIADAIREKNGTETTYKPSEMGDAVRGISGGGGGGVPPEALVLTGNCDYRFGYNGWNWFIEEYGDQITTEEMGSANNMFYNSSELEEIPFNLNFNNSIGFNSCNTLFGNCYNLKNIPVLNNVGYTSLSNIFSYCHNLRQIPENFVNNTWSFGGSYSFSGNQFYNCYSIRYGVNAFLKKIADGLQDKAINNSYTDFYSLYNCCSLDGVKLPVIKISVQVNTFSLTFNQCSRIKDLEFEKNEKEVITINWTNQTINLSNNIGYSNSLGKSYILNYNSGITADKEVTDDATYQALKNDPDWFTQKVEYSRYNHDSAVNTINSLPDVSAGTGNTIKFKGESGSATDGGAINTLTEEEIAVASAKGWTVTFV